MRFAIALLLLVVSVQLSFAQTKGLPVKVLEATKQSWVSGAPGGRTGTKFSVKVYINTKAKVEFKNLWIGKENVPFDVEFFSLDIQKRIEYGDSLLLTYNKVNGEKSDNPGARRLPMTYKGAALIETIVGGKARYFIVKAFKITETVRGQ